MDTMTSKTNKKPAIKLEEKGEKRNFIQYDVTRHSWNGDPSTKYYYRVRMLVEGKR